MAAGYIYVLANGSLPWLVNVGMTTTPLPDGPNELSVEGKLITPFKVVFEDYFDNGRAAEAVIHSALTNKGLRVSNTKQFFRTSVSDVLKTIASISPPLKLCGSRAGADVLSTESDDGVGDLLERDRVGKDTLIALDYYKKGAQRGYSVCYAEMAKVFIDARHTANARKSFFRFVECSKVSRQRSKPPRFVNEVLWALLKWDLSTTDADRRLNEPILEYSKELITQAEHNVDSYHVRTLPGKPS